MKKWVGLFDTQKETNNFGDLSLTVVAELRESPSHVVLKTKTFKSDAVEGEWHHSYYSVQAQIKAWAKSNGTKFTGQVS